MNVTAQVQAPGNDPVDLPYVSNGTALEAMAAVAMILRDYAQDTAERGAFRPSLLSIRVEVSS